MTGDMEELTARMAHTETRLAAAEARIAQMQHRARIGGSLGVLLLVGAVLMLSRPAAVAQGLGDPLASLLARVVTLETRTEAMTQTGTPGKSGALLTIKGDNVQIVSGSGRTDDWTSEKSKHKKFLGLGNLIIGYNEKRTDTDISDLWSEGDVRTGSHNLILGNWNNYSSYAGIVAGAANTISGSHATVTGGFQNIASNEFSSVTGGRGNTAGFSCTSVSGGVGNTAIGFYSSVSGGSDNTAKGPNSTVTGGECNTASGDASSVSGGIKVTQIHDHGWAGGRYHAPIQKLVQRRAARNKFRA